MNFKEQMNQYIKEYIASDAIFRDGQYEALKSIKDNNKTLIVQKTGWGKSLIYFLGTKYIKTIKPKGLTVVVSPLVSLMRDQVRNAEKFGLVAEKIIYTDNYREDFNRVKNLLINRKVDILFVSPERFANIDFSENVLPFLDITLFVIDEAHCISNWGHDFRPDYMRLVEVYLTLPLNTPLVLTTATANDRVIDDIEEQFGRKLLTLRGELTRESLELQVNIMPSQAERLAWIKDKIGNIKGSGIIYCATVKDTLKVTAYLRSHNIDVEEYHGSINYEDRIKKEDRLLNNKIKALVSTNALGMGFDKGDLAFVIHFQAPGSLVSYYQEIGRAGRNLANAKIILLHGAEDERIQMAFIDGKISESDLSLVFNEIKASNNGIKQSLLLNKLNMGKNMLDSALKVLLIRGYIYKVGPIYEVLDREFVIDLEKEALFRETQLDELKQFQEFINTKECYMKFIANKLNDHKATNCDKCANCLEAELISSKVSKESISDATLFLNGRVQMIQPKRQKPFGISIRGVMAGNIKAEQRNEEGRYLATYGLSGYGAAIKEQREADNYFSDELVEVAASYVKDKWADAIDNIKWITAIPSYLYEGLNESFATRLANKLNIPYHPVIFKLLKTREPQSAMNNTVKQFEHAHYSYGVDDEHIYDGPVLLIDDIINSGMTLFNIGLKLKDQGFDDVYPFALSSIL